MLVFRRLCVLLEPWVSHNHIDNVNTKAIHLLHNSRCSDEVHTAQEILEEKEERTRSEAQLRVLGHGNHLEQTHALVKKELSRLRIAEQGKGLGSFHANEIQGDLEE